MRKAILFDVIGTTVKEKNSEIIITCMQQAFSEYEIQADAELIKKNRGKDKKQIIMDMLNIQSQPPSLVLPIYELFKKNVQKNLDNFSESEEADAIFSFIRQKGIKLGIGTGLSKSLFHSICKHLGWNKYQFDYIGISGEIGKSRPDPAMIMG